MTIEEKLDLILDEYYPIHSFSPEIGIKIRKEAKQAIISLLKRYTFKENKL